MHKRIPPHWSLRRRLTVLIFSLVLLLWGISAAVIYKAADKESQELFDNSIRETADLLLFLSEHELQEMAAAGLTGPQAVEEQGIKHYLLFQVWDREGNLRYRSANAPIVELAPINTQGFAWRKVDGMPHRTFAMQDLNKLFTIVVAEPITHRQEIADEFLLHIILFSLVVLPVVYFSVRFLITLSLRDVNSCAAQVDRLDLQNLHRIEGKGLPTEIRPLVDGLNRAIARIDAGVGREKRFTADAAHELRSPLTIIQTNLQWLQKHSQTQDAMSREVIDDVLKGAHRASRLISQLLALSKVDQESVSQTLTCEVLNVRSMLQSVLEQEGHLALVRNIQVTSRIDHPDELSDWADQARLQGVPMLLELMLRNLVNNALRYCPSGSEVLVLARPVNEGLELRVQDNGPGIPVHLREQVFERFFRLDPTATHGSGLGLSICQQIAALHHTQLTWCEGLQGQGIGFLIVLPLNTSNVSTQTTELQGLAISKPVWPASVPTS